MEAGQLRQRVTLQRATEPQDSFGEVVKQWADVATVWAAVEPLSGREYLLAKQQGAELTTRIRIRYRDDVTPKMRVVWGEQTYDIDQVLPDPTHHRELVLMCNSVAG